MIRIDGTLLLTSPLSITEPGNQRINTAGEPDKKGFPCSQTSKWWIPATQERTAFSIPVINANTLRCGLRRAGAELVEEALIARGETITLDTYHSLRCGTPYGHPDKSIHNLTDIQEATAMPILGVHGGGPRMLHGALRVDTGIPITPNTIDAGLVSDTLRPLAVSGRLTNYTWLRRADDAADFSDAALAQKVIGDYAEQIEAWQTLLAKAEDAPEDATDDEGKFRKLQGLNVFEAVSPGTPFAVRFELGIETPGHVGYLLLALARLANKQRIGGYGRLGFGRFVMDLTIHLPDGSPVPALQRTRDTYAANTDHPQLAACVDEATRWLREVSAADLQRHLRPSETSVTDVRKKLASNPDQVEAFDRIFGKGNQPAAAKKKAKA